MAVRVLCLFLTVPWVGLQCFIVPSPGHTHIYFLRQLPSKFCTLKLLISPLSQISSNFNAEPVWQEGTKVYINCPDHSIDRAA